MNTVIKRTLLTGSAIVLLGAAYSPANAAPLEADDTTYVVGTNAANADQIVDANNDGTDNATIDLNGTDLTLGADGATAGINASGNGDMDASGIYFTNTDTTAATVTVEQDASPDSIVLDAGNTALTITVGQDSAATSASGNVIAVFDGNIDSSGGGTVSFVLGGDAVNTLQLDGATIDLNGGTITLGDTSDNLIFSGGGAQTITGAIDGAGDVSIDNAAGATFESAVGGGTAVSSITIEAAAGNSAATFENTVNATNGITLGGDGNGGDTNTLTLDITNTSFTTTGAITGTAGETNDIVVDGNAGNTATFASAIGAGGNISSITVGTAVGGNAEFDGAVTTGTFDVDATNGNSDAIFNGSLTATTVTLTDGGNAASLTFDNATSALQTIAGTIDGAGANEGNILVINGADSTTNQVSFTGNVGTTSGALDTITIGNGAAAGSAAFSGNVAAATITVDGTSGDTVGFFSGDVTTTTAFDISNGAIAILDDGDGSTITGAITDSTGDSNLIFRDTDASQNGVTVANDVGTNGNRIANIEIGESGATSNTATVTFESDVFANDLTVNNGTTTQTNAIFEGAVTITNTLAVEGTSTTNSSVARFQGGVAGNLALDTGGTIVLEDLGAPQTVTGTVTTLTDGAGALIIRDSDNGGEGYTVAGQVGTDGNRLRLIEVGEDDNFHNSGAATFESAVFADEISVLNGGTTTSVATFESTVASTDTIAIVGGDAGGEDSTAVFQAGVTAPLIALEDGAATAGATFNGGGMIAVSADIIGAADGNGIVTVDGGGTIVTFNNDIGFTDQTLPTGASVNAVNELSIVNGGVATFAGETKFNTYTITAGTYNNGGTMYIDNAITAGGMGTLELSTGGTKTVVLGDSFIGGTTVINAGGVINMTGDLVVKPASAFDTGTVTFVADQGAGNASDNAAAQMTVESAFRTYTIDDSGSAIAIVAGDAKSAATTATELGISTGSASKLNQAVTSTGTLPTAVETALDNAIAGTSTQANAAAEQLGDATATAGALGNASAGATQAANKNITQRFASLRSSEGQSGVAAGSGYTEGKVWARGTASFLDQDERNGVAGYDAETYGVTVGYDNEFMEDAVAGLAFTYAYTDVDGDSAANSEVEVDTYILTVYGSKSYGDIFTNATIHAGWNSADVAENVLGLGRLSGDFSTWQYGASAAVGYDYDIGHGITLTPSAGLDYTHIEGEGYTLSDGTNSTNEDFSDKDVFLGIVGVQVSGEHDAPYGGKFMPEAHANFLYDFASDETETSRTFTGGVIINDEEVEIAEETGQIGASLSYEQEDKMTTFSIGYDAEIREDFVGHTGKAKVSFKF